MAEAPRRLRALLGRIDRARERIFEEDEVPRWLKDVGPAVALLRADPAALRAWVRYRSAIRDGLGEPAAEAYGRVVAAVARKDGDMARVVAVTIPDHIARVPAARRDVYFALLEEVGRTRPAALGLLARTLPDLVQLHEDEPLRRFVLQGVELHATSHQRAESFLRRESDASHVAERALHAGVALAEVSRTLTLYARSHCGEDVQVRPGQGRAFTDGHHVYLPERVEHFGDARDFALYRVLTAVGAGYLEFGSFLLDLDGVPPLGAAWPDAREGEGDLERFFRGFPNTSLARELFQLLEDARIEARLRAEYPGIARDLDAVGEALRGKRTEPKASAARAMEALARHLWQMPALEVDAPTAAALAPLQAFAATLPSADVAAVARAVVAHYPAVDALMRKSEPTNRPPRSPGGERVRMPGSESEEPDAYRPPELSARIKPEAAGAEERKADADARRLRAEAAERGEALSPAEARERLREAERRRRELQEATAYAQMEAMLDRHPPPGGALVDPGQGGQAAPVSATGLPQDPDVETNGRTFLYREWDTTIGDYKPGWVAVRESRLREGDQAFVHEVMEREAHAIARLRKTFEALRPEGRARVRGMTDGDELDFDRVIQSAVESRITGERSDKLYTRTLPERREVAVTFLLDMSSSTNEATAAGGKRRVIDVEKEALIVVAEALHSIGDAFSIYGFSGYGRDHVAFYVAKEFRDPWDDRARERVGRIGFKMENRDGAAVRHATRKLLAEPARTRLLFLLSDGKPLDCGCDHYYDRYAQEDTRTALREARKEGVHPFCITVDPTGPAYLKHMYGDVGYCVIDRVDALPARIVQVYRRLAL